MAQHKQAPKIKIYKKQGLWFFFNTKKNFKKFKIQKRWNKRFRFRVFSPEIRYLGRKTTREIKRKTFKQNLQNFRKFKLFFGIYRTRFFKKLVRSELQSRLSQRHLLRELIFCSIVEQRVDIILFRLGLVNSLYESKFLIRSKNILLNGAPTTFSTFVRKSDIISLNPLIYANVSKKLKQNIGKRLYCLSNFNFLEVNFRTLKIVILTNKLNLFSQLLQYRFYINWFRLIEE